MANNTADTRDTFIIPSRTLRGSRQEMVQDIDQAIVGLLALRHLIDGGTPAPEVLKPGGPPRLRGQGPRWPRLFTALRPAGARR
jgi:hypothetical protein